MDVIVRSNNNPVNDMTAPVSSQNKSRYKCGSCCTCQESTNRCQTTQFIVACPSNIGDMCIHSKMTV